MTTPPAPEEQLRPRDWLDDILEDTAPAPAPVPGAGDARPAPAPDDDQEDSDEGEEPRRRPLRDILRRKPEQPAPPLCPHRNRVPVHAQPTGELVAELCQDCDEQLPPPASEEDEPEGTTEPAPPAKKPAARRGPRLPVATTPKSRAKVSSSHLRAIAFTGSAALFGYSVGLVRLLGAFLPAADHGATGTVGALLALAAAIGTWRVLGVPGVAVILPSPMISRIIACVIVAVSARSIAPDTVAWLNRYGRLAGLDASAVALLVTSAGMCCGLYWAIDRRFRTVWWPVRWLARIPLASAVLAVALYAPGPR
ncbi:hypothetical protein [Streptomyces anandii]|uniref:hypothetical protein n=1 Tax=Streptomyces anandii TaxID=285454 RepID=UPI0037BB4AA2